ncbi:hypothetical protein IQ269_15225 [Tychonema sp. LEGE 07199]|uniref:hypothetical protein n=1 Tax=unclassified Tychonema TaxID=2642144 RepID=UPI0018813501|nr:MULTISPECIES: hypothetical protein [unclassified Tychonema]MBE9122123.1 hypothetical protein [Tychonema sp. LEGE 07199]MBE9131456.1 hypothetical protein [Tychonema sp. LEGE 07196]
MAVIDIPFLVTGGETNRPPSNAFSPSQRQINIRAPLGIPSAEQWSGQKVWLLIPGFTDPYNYYDATLATVIKNANPNDTVLALDWTQVSGSLTNNGPAGIGRGDLYRSGSWITPVATAVRDKLVLEWGIPATELNIVGNSLGSHLASDLAASFTTYGSQVGSVTVLDPASNTAKFLSPYDTDNGYDTDLSNGYLENGGTPDPIKRLDFGGAAVSRSFNGISSLAGNEAQAGTAKESFLFDFGTDPNNFADQIAQHSRVVTAYINLVTTDASDNSRLATNILGLNDMQADHQFRPNFYKGDFDVSPQVHEGVIPVDAQNNPLFLVAANAAGGIDDRIIYGSNQGSLLLGSGNFQKYYNNNGNNTYYLGNQKDIVSAGIGNDTLFGGNGNDNISGADGNDQLLGEAGDDILDGANGNDLIFGGTGNDAIYGGLGNDTLDGGDGNNSILGGDGNDDLIGGNGINRLFGGLGNDTLTGGAGQNLLRGSEDNSLSSVEVDNLIGNSSSSLNAFYIGDATTNWYSAAGGNDYANIVGFNPANGVIIGGVNIEAQNLITKTFLWSGGELIAKIEGLWASQLESQFPTRIF